MNEDFQYGFDRVMIIDDNRIDLYIASRMITKNNFGKHVLQYSSALEALTYLQENQHNINLLPNILFIDIYMPGMSGFEFMVEYDKLSTALKQHCQVFIISSSNDEQDIERANSDKNVVSIEEKPISKEFLNKLKIGHTVPHPNHIAEIKNQQNNLHKI